MNGDCPSADTPFIVIFIGILVQAIVNVILFSPQTEEWSSWEWYKFYAKFIFLVLQILFSFAIFGFEMNDLHDFISSTDATSWEGYQCFTQIVLASPNLKFAVSTAAFQILYFAKIMNHDDNEYTDSDGAFMIMTPTLLLLFLVEILKCTSM